MRSLQTLKHTIARGKRITIDGVHFLRLQGTARERAQAHATLLKEEIQEGVLPYLATKNEWLIRRAPGILQNKQLQEIVVGFYNKLFLPFAYRALPEGQKRVMEDFAEYAGLPFEVIRSGVLQAEGLMFLSRLSVMQHLAERERLGCTSAVVLKENTLEKRLLVARNMDYPVVDAWEKQPTVLFHEPSEKDEIPHVAVTSAGVHTSGLTAMNAEGLTLATHAHFGKSFSSRGMPIITLGNEVISKAHSLEEAVRIAKSCRRSAHWAFVVASAKENDAIVIEMSPTETYVRHAEDEKGSLVHSNYFQTELRKKEAFLGGAVQQDLKARVSRMEEIVDASSGKVSYRTLLSALGDHFSFGGGKHRVYGDTISAITTIKSVIFEPETQTLWLSSRKESPTGLGNFLEIKAGKFWDNTKMVEEGERAREVINHPPYSRKFQQAIHYYHRAYAEWHTHNHDADYQERTLEYLRKATEVELAFKDSYLWMQRGLVAFVLSYYQEARECFETVKETDMHVSQVRDLFLARTYDLIGHRGKARELFQKQTSFADPRLEKAFARNRTKEYREQDKKTLLLDLQFPDPMQY
ncbi:hypothetical protein HYX13_03810 [Candidatus Woesearchaeota archaeon]|nr:hypothetical protein [Candidatus Woesearchaeota archaeon]